METNNKDTQTLVTKIPTFTVLKNGSILKNIFLIRKRSAAAVEEILLIGRHPNCHVTLEHPSISRHHLRVHSSPSSQTVSVVDLSSVHGTWVSGRKIKPGVRVKLKEGDTVRLGGSSRVYELHWVPRSQACDVDEQLVPAVCTIKEESDQIVDEKYEECSSGNDLECSDLSSSNEIHDSTLKALDPLASLVNENDDIVASGSVQASPVVSETTSATQVSDSVNNSEDQLMTNCSISSCDDTEVEHSSPLIGNENDDIFASVPVQAPLVVLETTSAMQVSDNLNGLEDKLMSNGSISSCDDAEVKYSSPWKTGNGNDDFFAAVTVEVPLVVSETTSATQVSDNLNGLEDRLMLNDSKSSCDDTRVEQSSPLKAGNGNGELFTTVCIVAPLVSETTSATRVSDNLNNSEDQLVLNCSKSSCDDTEVEHSSLLKAGNGNGELLTTVCIEAPLVSETTSALRVSDNFSDQLVLDCPKSSCDDTEVEQSSPLKAGNGNGELFSTVCTEAPLVSETTSATRVSDNLNNIDDQLMSNCSKSSCDDIEVEHSSPLKTGYEKGEIFTTVCIEAPLVSETTSATRVSDHLNNSEDQLVLNCSKSCDDTEVEHSSSLNTGNGNGKLFTTVCIEVPLVSETTSAARVCDNLNNSEDQLALNCSKSSCDDTEVEHSNPLKTGNENGELFTTVCVEAPLVSETTSATQVSDKLNNIDDQLMSNCSKSSCDDTEVEHSSPWKSGNGNGELFTTVCIQAPLVVSETASTTQVSDGNNSEDQLMANFSKCDDDTEVEHTSPWKTGNGNGELITPVCVQAPFDAAEDTFVTDISDSVNKSEDKLDWLRDNLSNEFDHISHEKDEKHDLFNTTETHEKDVLNENIARSSEIDIDNEVQQQTDNDPDEIRDVGFEFDLVNQIKMMDESASMVLYDGVDTSVNTESFDHEIMNKESVFEFLPDVADMDEDKTFTPVISEAKEIHSNVPSVQNVPASVKLLDSLDGKELEFYTPDKENRNPNPIVFGGKGIFGFSQKIFATDEGVCTELEVDQFVNGEEVLSVSSEKVSKSAQKTQNVINSSSQNFTKKRWTMVVDTNSLLDPKSLKHMKLLEGIKETRLIVPKIVVRELTDIKSQDGFFNRDSKKASLALKWIDECVMNTGWWIHMDDDETVHSSTTVPVLAIALHLREQLTDQKIIILSDNLTLKIKAMAEGIMCEAAEEFHENLVNPFSERFLWVGSAARGLTWSCVDDHDDVVRRKYHGGGFNGSQRFKGLKLLARAKASQLVN